MGGFPATLSSWKLAGAVTPVVAAVAVNLPALPLAVNGGEVATPEAFVCSLAWLWPPAKTRPRRPARSPRRRAASAARAERERHGRALDRVPVGVEHQRLQRLVVGGAGERRFAQRCLGGDRRGDPGRGVGERKGHRAVTGAGDDRVTAGDVVGGERRRLRAPVCVRADRDRARPARREHAARGARPVRRRAERDRRARDRGRDRAAVARGERDLEGRGKRGIELGGLRAAAGERQLVRRVRCRARSGGGGRSRRPPPP